MLIIADRKGREHELPPASAPLADTHGHLSKRTPGDAAAALMRAHAAGVRLQAIPVDPTDDVPDAGAFFAWFEETCARAGELGEHTCFIAGAHPYGAAALDGEALARLERLLDHPRCRGVGEIGLDYGPWNELPPDVQEAAFRIQLRIAHERGLPVELHLRDPNEGTPTAHIDALRILRDEGLPSAGCDLHCFTSGPEVMSPFTDVGCYISFGGAITFGRSDDIRAAAAACPAHLMLTETDCPYMAPVPLRGERCEPAMVAFTAACVADVRSEVLGVSRSDTYAALWENARRFFSLRMPLGT